MAERDVTRGIPSPGATELLAIVAAKGEVSRARIAEISGLNRVTVAQRLSELFDAELIEEGEQAPSTGGRPTRPIRLNRKFGAIAVADVGETTISLAITDLSPRILAQGVFEFDPRSDPARTIARIAEHFGRLAKSVGVRPQNLIGACLGIRAPVDFDAGVVVGPSIMVGWDDIDIAALLNRHIDVPVYVENDVNLLSIAAVRTMPLVRDMLFVKVGTGIGSGMIFDGRIYRGANGAAGDIGHIQFGDFDSPLCRCGKRGCVEARAAGWALARIRAALLLADTASVADLEQRVGDLAGVGNAWRHTARELLGLAAWRTGDYQAARLRFTDISADQESPADIRQRAQLMLTLIAAKIGPEAAEPEAAPAAAPAADAGTGDEAAPN